MTSLWRNTAHISGDDQTEYNKKDHDPQDIRGCTQSGVDVQEKQECKDNQAGDDKDQDQLGDYRPAGYDRGFRCPEEALRLRAALLSLSARA